MNRSSQASRPAGRSGLKSSSEDVRRKRDDIANALRKAKRDESMQKRRMTSSAAMDAVADESLKGITANPADLPKYLQQLMHCQDKQGLLVATHAVRKILSIEKNPPISQVIACPGAVTRLVQLLDNDSDCKLQFEACWALTNIGSGSSQQTMALVDNGAVPVLVRQMSAPMPELREQAVWCIGNIIGDSPQLRDFGLQYGALEPLLAVLQDGTVSISMLRNATWTLSNMCRGKPKPSFHLVRPALPVLANLIRYHDSDVMVDALWALSYLTDGSNDDIQEIVDQGMIPDLIHLLGRNDSTSIQTPTLRCIGNILTGTDTQTDMMIANGALYPLVGLLRSQRRTLKKEAAWSISNITAGNRRQTQNVFDTAGMIPELINVLAEADYETKKEAMWAISNATTWKDPSQIRTLVNAGLVAPMCEILKISEPKTTLIVFEAMQNILEVGQASIKSGMAVENEFISIFEEAEAIERLETLQDHAEEKVYKRAMQLLEDFFEPEEDEENDPNPHDGGFAGYSGPAQTYQFGGQQQQHYQFGQQGNNGYGYAH